MSAPTWASGRAPARRPALRALSPRVALSAVVVAALAVRLIAGALGPLSEDEAYYRLWSLQPALGYFDHPPMIAWWIWAGRQIAGDTPLGVRLLPILAAGVTTLLTFDLARALGFSECVAARAGVWLNATVLMGLGGQLAVPDQPNALFWTATLCCAVRATSGRPAWWLGAGAMAGLACLSKYSALFLAPGVLLWLALTPDGRRALRTPWPWLAAAVALAVFAPNIAWNASHGWMTFAKQFGRIEPTAGLQPSYVLKFVTDQFVLLNPLIAVFVGLAVRRRIAWPLLAIAAPFAAYLLVHSLHDEVQGQWPAPLYPMLMVAAAAAAEGVTGWRAGLRAAAAPLAFAVFPAMLAFTLLPSDGRLPFRDPAMSLRGWPAFLHAVEAARVKAGASWIGAPTYGIAAQLAASPHIHAPAVEFYERERFTFETPAERADFSKPGLIVVPGRGAGAGAMRGCFASVQMLPEIDRGAGRGMTRYAVFRVEGPKRDIQRTGCFRPPLLKF
ncbi:MAG TPA: glycosyltransferase family 39 protein [Caulobacteraceae bacterium]|nr:glycosyltransferase family 39 protein [Caulobacteraceae bacterium]